MYFGDFSVCTLPYMGAAASVEGGGAPNASKRDAVIADAVPAETAEPIPPLSLLELNELLYSSINSTDATDGGEGTLMTVNDVVPDVASDEGEEPPPAYARDGPAAEGARDYDGTVAAVTKLHEEVAAGRSAAAVALGSSVAWLGVEELLGNACAGAVAGALCVAVGASGGERSLARYLLWRALHSSGEYFEHFVAQSGVEGALYGLSRGLADGAGKDRWSSALSSPTSAARGLHLVSTPLALISDDWAIRPDGIAGEEVSANVKKMYEHHVTGAWTEVLALAPTQAFWGCPDKIGDINAAAALGYLLKAVAATQGDRTLARGALAKLLQWPVAGDDTARAAAFDRAREVAGDDALLYGLNEDGYRTSVTWKAAVERVGLALPVPPLVSLPPEWQAARPPAGAHGTDLAAMHQLMYEADSAKDDERVLSFAAAHFGEGSGAYVRLGAANVGQAVRFTLAAIARLLSSAGEGKVVIGGADAHLAALSVVALALQLTLRALQQRESEGGGGDEDPLDVLRYGFWGDVAGTAGLVVRDGCCWIPDPRRRQRTQNAMHVLMRELGVRRLGFPPTALPGEVADDGSIADVQLCLIARPFRRVKLVIRLRETPSCAASKEPSLNDARFLVVAPRPPTVDSLYSRVNQLASHDVTISIVPEGNTFDGTNVTTSSSGAESSSEGLQRVEGLTALEAVWVPRRLLARVCIAHTFVLNETRLAVAGIVPDGFEALDYKPLSEVEHRAATIDSYNDFGAMRAALSAVGLARGEAETALSYAQRLCVHLRNVIEYDAARDFAENKERPPSHAFNTKVGTCGRFSASFQCALRAHGIPSRGESTQMRVNPFTEGLFWAPSGLHSEDAVFIDGVGWCHAEPQGGIVGNSVGATAEHQHTVWGTTLHSAALRRDIRVVNPAFADPERYLSDIFAEMDVDGSGTLTRKELRLLLASAFGAGRDEDSRTLLDAAVQLLDADADGAVSREEFLRAAAIDGPLLSLIPVAETYRPISVLVQRKVPEEGTSHVTTRSVAEGAMSNASDELMAWVTEGLSEVEAAAVRAAQDPSAEPLPLDEPVSLPEWLIVAPGEEMPGWTERGEEHVAMWRAYQAEDWAKVLSYARVHVHTSTLPMVGESNWGAGLAFIATALYKLANGGDVGPITVAAGGETEAISVEEARQAAKATLWRALSCRSRPPPETVPAPVALHSPQETEELRVHYKVPDELNAGSEVNLAKLSPLTPVVEWHMAAAEEVDLTAA